MEEKKPHGVSRRDFAKLTAAAGFAIAASRPSKVEANEDTLKVGLLGCGGRGTGAAEQMLEGNENVKLIALGDLFEDKLNHTRRKLTENPNGSIRKKADIDDDHCFVGFDAYKKICDTDIDILLIGTIPYGKPEQLEVAAEKGKHVFIEKPIAVDPVGVRKFMKAAQAHKDRGLSLVAGTQRRHQKEYQETIKKIHDGEIGEVVSMRAYWCGGLPFLRERKAEYSDAEYRIRNWINYCWTSGDNIVEQHIHNLDVCNWVMNDHPTSVFASGGRTWKPREEKYGDLYDHFSCDYEYGNGVHMMSMSRHWDGCDTGVFEDVFGTKGYSSCKDMGKAGLNPYVQEHIDLVNSIRETGPKWHEGQQVAESTLTALMGRMSAYTGKRISWEQAMESDLSIVPDEINFDVEIPVWSVPVPVRQKKIR